MNSFDKLHHDAIRLASAAESQAAVIAKFVANVDELEDRYVEKLDEIKRLRAAGDALADARLKVCVMHPDPLLAAWQEARK